MEYEYEVVDHGVENPQYFQGCGTTFTIYEWCQTGIGDDFDEAMADALDGIAQTVGQEFNFGEFCKKVLEENVRTKKEVRQASVSRIYSLELANNEEVDMYYHVSIRYNIETKKRESSEHTGFDNGSQ